MMIESKTREDNPFHITNKNKRTRKQKYRCRDAWNNPFGKRKVRKEKGKEEEGEKGSTH